MRISATIASMFLVAGFTQPAFSQQTEAGSETPTAHEPASTGWDIKFQLEASPRVGRPLTAGSDEFEHDESEYGASVSFRNDDFLDQEASVQLGITYSPDLLNRVDQESTRFVKFTVGNDAFPLRERTARYYCSISAQPELKPAASFQFSDIHDDFFDGRSRSDYEFTLGATYSQAVDIDCPATQAASQAGSTDRSGFEWELKAQVARVWSDDNDEERIVPQLRLKVSTNPLGRGISLYGEAQAEWRFYDHAPLPTGTGTREDQRLRLTAGIDFSKNARLDRLGIGFGVAVQYQQRWSNDDTRDHRRFYVIPSVTFEF